MYINMPLHRDDFTIHVHTYLMLYFFSRVQIHVHVVRATLLSAAGSFYQGLLWLTLWPWPWSSTVIQCTCTCTVYLSIHDVLESRLTHLGVDLVVGGVGELWTKGVVEGQCVAEVPQSSTIRLAVPLSNL